MRREAINVMLGLLVAFGLAGCGGGGNDVSTSYKGSTAQATVTAGNAKALSVDASQVAQDTGSVGVLGKSVTPNASPQLQSIAAVLENSISSVHPQSGAAKTVAAAAEDTVPGYSGSFSFSIDVNESTGAFTGTISFNDYREYSYSAVLSGSIHFSGDYSRTYQTFTSMDITVSNLQGIQGNRSLTINGSMSFSNTGYTKSLIMSVVLLDSADNRTYWLKDYTATLAGDTMSISGTYYDHDHGYVVISTVTPLAVSEFSSTPKAGQLLFTGSNGTKARLTYTSSGYILEVDAGGNDTYVVVP